MADGKRMRLKNRDTIDIDRMEKSIHLAVYKDDSKSDGLGVSIEFDDVNHPQVERDLRQMLNDLIDAGWRVGNRY